MRCFLFRFYIKPQPVTNETHSARRCFLFRFYIKPQPRQMFLAKGECCFLFRFYIKPQPTGFIVADNAEVTRILRCEKFLFALRRSGVDAIFAILLLCCSKYSQKNSNCCGVVSFSCSTLPQKLRISPNCLSVTLKMLTYPLGGIED